MSEEPVLLTWEERGAAGRVATVTLNNPAKLNAMGRGLMTAFLARMDALRGAADLRAVVLTGAGSRAFVGGRMCASWPRSIPPRRRHSSPWCTAAATLCAACRCR
jgi:enoyl-CoA hydratase/carnithine racemase